MTLETELVACPPRRPCAVCDHVQVPVAALTLAFYLLRRVRPATIALVMYETWRRLPPQQRQQLVLAARRNGPRVAGRVMRRGRPRF
jgi:hypothetical protein